MIKSMENNTSLWDKKSALRKAMRLHRSEYAKQKPQAAEIVRNIFLESIHPSPNSVVALTIPQQDELDPRPLALALLKKGHQLCLPIVKGKNTPLVFSAWNPGDPLTPGPLNITQPLPTAKPCRPDILLVPLLAFDRQGNRLGQGGGYYDRTLAILRKRPTIMAIGLAYAQQEVPSVPTDSNDQPLDVIITDKEIIIPTHD